MVRHARENQLHADKAWDPSAVCPIKTEYPVHDAAPESQYVAGPINPDQWCDRTVGAYSIASPGALVGAARRRETGEPESLLCIQP